MARLALGTLARGVAHWHSSRLGAVDRSSHRTSHRLADYNVLELGAIDIFRPLTATGLAQQSVSIRRLHAGKESRSFTPGRDRFRTRRRLCATSRHQETPDFMYWQPCHQRTDPDPFLSCGTIRYDAVYIRSCVHVETPLCWAARLGEVVIVGHGTRRGVRMIVGCRVWGSYRLSPFRDVVKIQRIAVRSGMPACN